MRTICTAGALALALALAPACTEDEPCHGDCAHEDAGTTADAALTPAQTYCNCMLIACHEPFHDRWGESDETALANCSAEAEALPAGMAGDDTGSSLACRQTHCDGAASDPAAECPAALGDAVCM